MYLPVIGEAHVRPMMGMLASPIYVQRLNYDDIWDMVEKQNTLQAHSQSNK